VFFFWKDRRLFSGDHSDHQCSSTRIMYEQRGRYSFQKSWNIPRLAEVDAMAS